MSPRTPAIALLGSALVAACSGHAVPFRLVDNRIFVDATIDGRGPFTFAFDTGGSASLTPTLAQALGLASRDAGVATGAGNGRVPIQEATVDRFAIGDVVLVREPFLVIDYGPIQRAFGFAHFDGLFGAEVLARFAARITFPANPGDPGSLEFLSHVEARDRAGFDAIPFDIVANKPVVRGTIDGVPARILVDTGDRSALTILTRFAAHAEIASDFPDPAVRVTGVGIGGPIPALLGRVGQLALSARAVLRDVVARQPVTQGGFNALEGIDASIGNEVLRQFTLIVDYSARTLYLAPNEAFGTPTRFTPVPFPPSL